MDNLFWKIAAGAIIPSAATIIFNILNFVFEHYGEKPRPPLSESTFDIAVGCAFSLIGICVATADHEKNTKLLIVFTSLILFLLAGELLAPMFLNLSKIFSIGIIDVTSFFALCWAISETEETT